MTNYSIWQQAAPPLNGSSGGIGSQGTNAQTVGTVFYSSASGSVTQIWYFSATSSYSTAGSFTAINALPAAVALYDGSGTVLYSSTSPTWSGAAASGWVSTNITSTAISASTEYIVAVEGNATSGSSNYWHAYSFGYFGTGDPGSTGISNGILTAPGANSTSNAQAQGNVHNSAGDGTAGTLQFPSANFANANWWIDVTVSAAGPPPGTPGLLMATGF